MAVITPVGKDFDWSPKEQSLVKTASTKIEKSDKDLLYDAAKKVVAQFMDLNKDMGAAPCDEGAPCNQVGVEGVSDGIGDSIGGDIGGDIGEVVPDAAPEATDVAAPVGETADVQKAVKELVDKANKAEETAAKVEEAVGKVEEAVQGVKDAVGVASDEIVDEVEIEIEDEEGGEEKGEKGKNPFEKGDKEDKDDDDDDDDDKGDDDKGDKEEIVKESKEACASSKHPKMKSAASEDDLVVFAKLSPSVKKKVYDYYKNDLKYAPDYCKLLVQDN